MAQVLKKYLLWAILGGILYGFLSYHIIIIDKSVKLLRKSELTLEYTLFSTHGKRNHTIMAIDELREVGIGELLVEAGKMTEDDYQRLMNKYAYEEDEYD